MIKADISRFFHSIYTHSISWALHGKVDSKNDRRKDSPDLYGNRLDYIIRQSQDGQTIGIPVGPDFSRIISEILGAAIDEEFRRRHGSEIPLLRLVDDIYIGADTKYEAEKYLSSMRDAIRGFELDINENKTAIVPSSEDLEPYWPVAIRREIESYKDYKYVVLNGQKNLILFIYWMS